MCLVLIAHNAFLLPAATRSSGRVMRGVEGGAEKVFPVAKKSFTRSSRIISLRNIGLLGRQGRYSISVVPLCPRRTSENNNNEVTPLARLSLPVSAIFRPSRYLLDLPFELYNRPRFSDMIPHRSRLVRSVISFFVPCACDKRNQTHPLASRHDLLSLSSHHSPSTDPLSKHFACFPLVHEHTAVLSHS